MEQRGVWRSGIYVHASMADRLEPSMVVHIVEVSLIWRPLIERLQYNSFCDFQKTAWNAQLSRMQMLLVAVVASRVGST